MTTPRMAPDSIDWIASEAHSIADASEMLGRSRAALRSKRKQVEGYSAVIADRLGLVEDIQRRAHAQGVTPREGVTALLAMIDLITNAYKIPAAIVDQRRSNGEEAIGSVVTWRAEIWADYLAGHREHEALMYDVIRRRNGPPPTDSASDVRALRLMLSDAAGISAATTGEEAA